MNPSATLKAVPTGAWIALGLGVVAFYVVRRLLPVDAITDAVKKATDAGGAAIDWIGTKGAEVVGPDIPLPGRVVGKVGAVEFSVERMVDSTSHAVYARVVEGLSALVRWTVQVDGRPWASGEDDIRKTDTPIVVASVAVDRPWWVPGGSTYELFVSVDDAPTVRVWSWDDGTFDR